MSLLNQIQDFINSSHEPFCWEMANHENDGLVHLAAHIGGRRVCANLDSAHTETETGARLKAWLESVKEERKRYNAKSAT